MPFNCFKTSERPIQTVFSGSSSSLDNTSQLGEKTVRVATTNESKQVPPLSRSFSDRVFGLITSLKNRVISVFKMFSPCTIARNEPTTVVSKNVLFKMDEEKISERYLSGPFNEYKEKSEGFYDGSLAKEINDSLVPTVDEAIQEGTTKKLEAVLDGVLGIRTIQPHGQFSEDVHRSSWTVQGQTIVIENSDNEKDAKELSREKSEAILSKFHSLGVDEPAQWLITALATQTSLAFLEKGLSSYEFGVITQGQKSNYEVQVEKDMIQLTIHHKRNIVFMDFDKVESLSEDFEGIFDDEFDAQKHPDPAMDPVEGELSFKLTINMLKDKGSSSISDITDIKYNNTDIKVNIKAEKTKEEQ